MTPIERNAKYRELLLTDRHDDSRVVVYIHRRCGCLVSDIDAHEQVCFDRPVQLELTPLSQHHFEQLTGGK